MDIHSDLIRRCKDGDDKAQYELYCAYVKAMFNTAFRITNSLPDAEDVIQESFVRAFERIGTFREESSFGAWLKRIVVNQALNLVKQRNRTDLLLEDFARENDTDQPVDNGSDAPYTVRQVKDAMLQLPDGFRTVISLYLFEGYDHREISEIMGISESTSKTQYLRAKRKLLQLVKREHGHEN